MVCACVRMQHKHLGSVCQPGVSPVGDAIYKWRRLQLPCNQQRQADNTFSSFHHTLSTWSQPSSSHSALVVLGAPFRVKGPLSWLALSLPACSRIMFLHLWGTRQESLSGPASPSLPSFCSYFPLFPCPLTSSFSSTSELGIETRTLTHAKQVNDSCSNLPALSTDPH